MRTSVLRSLARLSLVLTVCAISGAVIRGQETPASSSTSTLAGSKLIGEWQFNKDHSTPAPAEAAGGESGQRGGRGGRSGGGGFGGRGGFGGGFGGGYGAGYNTGRPNEEQMLQMRALLREVNETPDRVTLVATDTTVSFTDNQGIVRKYATSGKREKIELGTAKIDVVTKWTGQELTQEFTAGALKVTERYGVSADGKQLTETITVQGAAAAGGAAGGNTNQTREITRVFDRVG
jgi:hypothetical protein